MSTPKFRRPSTPAGLLGLGLMFVISGCGRSGISGLRTSLDGSVIPDGGQGGASSSGETSGQGGTTITAGSSGQGGASSSGETSGQGGKTVMAGSSGQGGVSSSGETSGQGGKTVMAGSSGQGGASSSGGTSGQGGKTVMAGSSGQGGASSSGGNSGGQSGTTTGPRVPKSHRPQASSCAGVFAPAEPVNPQSGTCKSHADCTQGTNGRCITGTVGRGAGYNYFCTYDSCATDADCDRGKVCYCQGQSAQCFTTGNCRTDADCLGGAISYCSPAYGNDCAGYHWYTGYYCHTPQDTCIDDSDCTGKNFCDFDVIDGRWECKAPNMSCAIG